MNRQYNKLIWKEVVWRRPFEFESIVDLLTQLSGLTSRKSLIWEIRGRKDKVRYYLGCDEADIVQLEKLFKSHGKIDFSTSSTIKRKAVAHCKQLKVTRPVLSLKTSDYLAVTRACLAVMAQVGLREELVLQIIIGSSMPPKAVPNKMPDPNASLFQVIAGQVPPASSETHQLARDKAGNHQFNTVVRLGVFSGSTARNVQLTQDLLSSLRILESTGAKLTLKSEKIIQLDEAHAPWSFPLKLSTKELANIFMLPVGHEALPGVQGLHPKLMLPKNNELDKQAKRSFGMTIPAGDSGDKYPLSISAQDSLQHTVLTGPTGAGKSNAMLTMILNSIDDGQSVLVIDPKTDLVNDVLTRMPEHRKKDVVVIDPSSPLPVGFNPLALTNFGQCPELIADAVLAVFKDVFSENWGIRSQDVLSSSLLTLARLQNTSLVMLPSLLTDKPFRQRLLKDLDDKLGLEAFWNWFESLSDGERSQLIAPVLNKVRQFLLRPNLRNVLGQVNPKFSLIDLFYKRKIVLISLNKGIIGAESAQLLGSLVVGLTWTFALNRGQLAPEKRHIISIFIDELQDYLRLPTDLSDALSQARGLGIGLTLAHQYRSQLTPNIRAGIDANCHNKIVFGLNMVDAKEMASQTNELEAIDFNLLPRYHIYANLLYKGHATGWLSGKTTPPSLPTQSVIALRAESAKRYGRSVAEIEDEYLILLGYQANQPPFKSNPVVANHNTNSNDDIGRKKR